MDPEINGQKAAFMIDDGRLWDQVWLFGTPLVDRLGLNPAGKDVMLGMGKGNPTEAYAAQNVTSVFGDIEFQQQSVLAPDAADFGGTAPAGRRRAARAGRARVARTWNVERRGDA